MGAYQTKLLYVTVMRPAIEAQLMFAKIEFYAAVSRLPARMLAVHSQLLMLKVVGWLSDNVCLVIERLIEI